MATFLEMQTRVNRRVIDLPSAVVAEVPGLINAALRTLQARHNFKVMEAQINAITQGSVQSNALFISAGVPVTLPKLGLSYDVFKEWRGEPFALRNVDGGMIPLTHAVINRQAFSAFGFGIATNPEKGEPRVIQEQISSDEQSNRTMAIFPLPDGRSDYSDGEYRIYLPYWRYMAPLVASGDNNWFTNDPAGEEYIVKVATAEAHALNWDFEKQALLLSSSKAEYDEIVGTDKRYKVSSINEFVPHWRGARDNRTRI